MARHFAVLAVQAEGKSSRTQRLRGPTEMAFRIPQKFPRAAGS